MVFKVDISWNTIKWKNLVFRVLFRERNFNKAQVHHWTATTLRRFSQFALNGTALQKALQMLVEKLVSTINSYQDPVITADQPVYALGKQVQWMYPNRFKNFV